MSMIVFSLVLAVCASGATAATSFDCKLSLSGSSFDLNPLAGPHSFQVTTTTPPTITKTNYALSLCAPLPPPSSTPADSADICPTGTYLCQTTYTSREGLEDRILSVVPIASDSAEPGARAISGVDVKEGWEFVQSGGEYNKVKQSVVYEMRCDRNAKETIPTLTSYDQLSGELHLKWVTAAACPVGTNNDPTPPPSTPPTDDDRSGDGNNSGRGGMGFFGVLFIILLIAIAAYFVLGSYYNYTQYGATGWDMIPNRDLWSDLPYMIGDFFKGRGSSRSGYSALG